MNRADFLKQIWKPYPSLNPGFVIVGRMEVIKGKHVAIANKGQWILAESIRLDSTKFSAEVLKEILSENDWLALQIENDQVVEIQLLAPCLERPLLQSSSPAIQQKWFQFIEKTRDFFRHKEFQEAQTPSLVVCPGTEPFLDLFSTELKVGSRNQKLFLPTSPELHLKKMLAAGYENIFEIKSCFRNGEITDRHQPEFQMIEWYRSFSDLDQIIQDCLHLLEFLGASVEGFHRKSMAQLFQEMLQFELTPRTSIEELKTLAQKLNLSAKDYLLWDDVFYLIFIEKIEPFIDSTQPFFLEKYPPSQAALARLTPDGWGERFELYWKGYEIANAFHELNDPEIQIQRFQADLDHKKNLGKEIPPLDLDFLRALRSGMPPSSGVALGLERLFMALHGVSQISQLKVFPYKMIES